jgi:hypothetical protein
MKFTSGDVAEIADTNVQSIKRWVASSLLSRSSTGRGRHRTYTISDAIAAAAGALYRREGADQGRIQGVIKFLSSRPLEQLEADLAAGRSFPVPATMLGSDCCIPGVMIAPLADNELTPGAKRLLQRLDLVAIVARVKAKVKQLAARPRKKGKGRKRGLGAQVKCKGGRTERVTRSACPH